MNNLRVRLVDSPSESVEVNRLLGLTTGCAVIPSRN